MTDPQWTVDPDHSAIRWSESPDVWVVVYEDVDDHDAWGALVAAVRDAATLRQARQELELVVHTTVTRYIGGFRLGDDVAAAVTTALLDLLSPPMSPDTPTPTGQT